jgi:DNA polymerase-3 subunit alpha
MYFGTFLDRSGAFIDTVHFPPVAGRYAWQGRGIYEVRGRVLEDFDALSIECLWMQKLRYRSDPRYADSSTRLKMISP